MLEKVIGDELDAPLRQAVVHWTNKILREIVANTSEVFAKEIWIFLFCASCQRKLDPHLEVVRSELLMM